MLAAMQQARNPTSRLSYTFTYNVVQILHTICWNLSIRLNTTGTRLESHADGGEREVLFGAPLKL